MKYLIFNFFFLSLTYSFSQKKLLKNVSGETTCEPLKEINANKIMGNKIDKRGKNVLGTDLQIAGEDPITGYYRDGYCSTGAEDEGVHIIAAVLTDEFLRFSKDKGNDLITPRPEYGFVGLKENDRWCLCASRWKEAFEAGVAPPIILQATHEKALEFVTLDELKTKQFEK